MEAAPQMRELLRRKTTVAKAELGKGGKQKIQNENGSDSHYHGHDGKEAAYWEVPHGEWRRPRRRRILVSRRETKDR